jgi:sporulation protein YlmC with PRC-barrel domain
MSRPSFHNQSLILLESAEVVGALLHTQNPTHLYRGMAVQSSEGHAVGHVAAVALHSAEQRITHILLQQECHGPAYRLIPLAAVQQVGDNFLALQLTQSEVEQCALWHST